MKVQKPDSGSQIQGFQSALKSRLAYRFHVDTGRIFSGNALDLASLSHEYKGEIIKWKILFDNPPGVGYRHQVNLRIIGRDVARVKSVKRELC